MNSRVADLHLHTLCSDGQLSPSELIHLVHQRGLTTVALTDHDTIEGIRAAQQAGAGLGVEVIPGVELSVAVGEEEVHLLGYYFDPEHETLQEQLARFRRQRHTRAEAIVQKLKSAGAPVSMNDVLEKAQGGALGRPHIAAALLEAGHVATQQEAFRRFLVPGTPAYVPRQPYAASEALALLHSAGGIGVLAHPGQWTSSKTIQSLIHAGLDGIETVHPSHVPFLTEYYRHIADCNGLIKTGGSDFHGWRPQDHANLGRYTISYNQVESIRRRAA